MTSSIRPSPPPFDCAAVDARLADYLDDEPPTALTVPERAAVDRHVATCARCRALVRDLRAIAGEAAALPPLAPSRDLWANIAPRLTSRTPAPAPAPARDDAPARVLPFEVRHVRHAPPPQHDRRGVAHVTWPLRRLAAAAVLLVSVSAGSTYLLTRAAGPDAAGAPAPTQVAAAGRPASAEPRAAAPRPAGPSAATTGANGAPARAAEPSDDPRRRAAEGAGESAARLVARRGADPAAVDAAVPAAAAYDREIAALRAVVRDRREELDSATVAVLVRNLAIIDAAIAQSRAALARDPQSQFLGDQLTRALGQKVELLRTVALLPRT
jgi:hypothetical protein